MAAATVSGTIELRDSRVASVSKQKDFSGVVISAERVNAPPSAAARTCRHAAEKEDVHAACIWPSRPAQSVDFPNSDPIFHNAFSSYNGQISTWASILPAVEVGSFRAAGRGSGLLQYPSHDERDYSGAQHALVRADGQRWLVPMDLPPANTISACSTNGPRSRRWPELTRRIAVTDRPAALPPITVSEAGYLLAAHKNKYGKDYTPPPDDQVFIPA